MWAPQTRCALRSCFFFLRNGPKPGVTHPARKGAPRRSGRLVFGSCCSIHLRCGIGRSGLDASPELHRRSGLCPEPSEEISRIGGPPGATLCRRPVFRCTPGGHSGPLVLLKHFLMCALPPSVAVLEAYRRRPLGLPAALTSPAATYYGSLRDLTSGPANRADRASGLQRKAPPGGSAFDSQSLASKNDCCSILRWLRLDVGESSTGGAGPIAPCIGLHLPAVPIRTHFPPVLVASALPKLKSCEINRLAFAVRGLLLKSAAEPQCSL